MAGYINYLKLNPEAEAPQHITLNVLRWSNGILGQGRNRSACVFAKSN